MVDSTRSLDQRTELMAGTSLPGFTTCRMASRTPATGTASMASAAGGRRLRLRVHNSRKLETRSLVRNETATQLRRPTATITPAGRSFHRDLIVAIRDGPSSLLPETMTTAAPGWIALAHLILRGKTMVRAMIVPASIASPQARTARRSRTAPCSLLPVHAATMAADGSTSRQMAIAARAEMIRRGVKMTGVATESVGSLGSISISRS